MSKKKPSTAGTKQIASGATPPTAPKTPRPGMFVRPRMEITPSMMLSWRYSSRCSSIFGKLTPADEFCIVAVEGLSSGSMMGSIDAKLGPTAIQAILEAPGQGGGRIDLQERYGHTRLALTTSEYRLLFAAV